MRHFRGVVETMRYYSVEPDYTGFPPGIVLKTVQNPYISSSDCFKT